MAHQTTPSDVTIHRVDEDPPLADGLDGFVGVLVSAPHYPDRGVQIKRILVEAYVRDPETDTTGPWSTFEVPYPPRAGVLDEAIEKAVAVVRERTR